jgi:hypothetical protein
MLVTTQLARASRRAADDESRADLEPLDLALLLGEQEEAIERAQQLDLDLLTRGSDELRSLTRSPRPAARYVEGWV